MIRVDCPGCQTTYRFDESLLQGRERGQAKCKKCGGKIEISLPKASPAITAAAPEEEPASQDTTARVRKMRSDEVGEETTSMSTKLAEEAIELPADKKYSLAVLQGKATGQIFPITKSRTTIGRSGTDILLDDSECSRRHAVLEVKGLRATICDLDSTNGTFVNGKRTDRGELENHSEFRVGDHVMMFIVTDRE